MNPFLVSRLELDSPRPLEQVWAELERLVREGFEAGGYHYRLFGSRRGRYFSMSLGMPLLGGAAPVLRAWLRGDPGAPRFEVSIGARLELIVLGGFWLLITVLGGGYQLWLQLRALAAGSASASDVVAVLPGIAIMLGILLLGFWLFRRRAVADARLLLAAFRNAIGAGPPAPSLTPTTPY